MPLSTTLPLMALLDLVLPRRCAGCEASVPVSSLHPLCPACAETVPPASLRAILDPAPPGMPPAWAGAAYEGPVRSALLAAKERGRGGIDALMGSLLSRSLVSAAAALPSAVVAVPVPCSPLSRRHRRDDVVLRWSRRACRLARAAGVQVRLAPALRHNRAVRDQGGLSAVDRVSNLAGALVVRAAYLPVVSGAQVIVLDDVVTTGATVAEAARALRVAGASVAGAAAVAATARRGGRVRPTVQSGTAQECSG